MHGRKWGRRMLRTLGPEDPIVEHRVLVVGAVFFFVCGLQYKRIAEDIQRRSGHSDRVKAIGIAIMRPMAFVMAAASLLFAYMSLK